MLKYIYVRKIALSYIVGATYLGFFDYLQTKFGVEIYPNNYWPVIKITSQFGILAILLSFAVPWFEKNFLHMRFQAKIKEAFFEMLFFGFLYIITLFSNYSSISTTFVFLCLTFARFLISYKKGDWKYCLLLGTAGPAIESILVSLNVFKYNHSNIGNIPYWLPILWFNAGFLCRRLFNLKILRNKI